MPGKVNITLQNVKIERKEDQFKSMSPWAVVMFDGQKKTTKIAENGNLEPEYNESWVFQRNSDVKITVSLYKKEYSYDALKNEKEIDLLIGKGSLNILSTLKRAKKQPASIVIDLLYDYDNKIAGQAYLQIQFTPGTNLQEYRNQENIKKIQKLYDSSLIISNLTLTLDTPNNNAVKIRFLFNYYQQFHLQEIVIYFENQNNSFIVNSFQDLKLYTFLKLFKINYFNKKKNYYVKVRNPNSSNSTIEQQSGKSIAFQGEYEVYFKNQKLVYFDVQEITRDEQLDLVIGDDLVGIGILDLDKNDPNETKQTIPIRYRSKQIGSVNCQIKYQIFKEDNIQEEQSQIRLSNDEIKEQIKNLEKKDKFWLSPERFQLDQQLKKKSILDRRSMLMKHRSVGQLGLGGNESQLFVKQDERNLISKPDIVVQTKTVKLPKIKTNNQVEVPTEFHKQYLRDIHGVGFSTVESSSTLQRSVPKFSIPESKRFLDPKEQIPGPGRYGTNGVANDNYVAKKFKKITAISEVRTTKQERKPRQTIDTGLKKPAPAVK